MSSRALTLLGVSQLVHWGVLYYAFPVLWPLVRAELDAPAWAVTGAMSAALLVSAALAPAVGRLSDRGHAVRAVAGGAIAAAAAFACWTRVPGLAGLYAVWAALGVSMAFALYEPAFTLIARTHGAPERRLRALATVTVFGGLASTVFLPLTGALTEAFGWRGATLLLAAALATSGVIVGVVLGPVCQQAAPIGAHVPRAARDASAPPGLILVLCAAGFVSAGFIANLVPTLGERGVPPSTAAVLGGLFGLLQLPGRAWLVSPRASVSPARLVTWSLGLQAAGVLLIAATRTTALVALGVMVFAAGAGLTTLARPILVQALVPLEASGAVNGRLARAQQVARAFGPVGTAWLAAAISSPLALVGFGVSLAVLAAAAPRVTRARVA